MDAKYLNYRAVIEAPKYDDDGTWIGEKLALATKSCDCCSRTMDITPRSLADAIADAESWLEYLRTLEQMKEYS